MTAAAAHEPLTVDRNELERFVEAVFRHADDGTMVAIRAFTHTDEPFTPAWRWVPIDSTRGRHLIDMAAGAITACARATEQTVFCPPVCTFAPGSDKADEASIANGLTLAVELDARADEARARLEGLLGPDISPGLR
ncbi:MAG: hypothetical protein GVY13_14710 [Alphaproteobacteria bacterium]|jgi:hypothetical protein|nr:hypothetical protein [Alphaproteobacteria bacterium]